LARDRRYAPDRINQAHILESNPCERMDTPRPIPATEIMRASARRSVDSRAFQTRVLACVRTPKASALSRKQPATRSGRRNPCGRRLSMQHEKPTSRYVEKCFWRSASRPGAPASGSSVTPDRFQTRSRKRGECPQSEAPSSDERRSRARSTSPKVDLRAMPRRLISPEHEALRVQCEKASALGAAPLDPSTKEFRRLLRSSIRRSASLDVLEYASLRPP
jgi:hypothetical protein